MSDNPLTDDDLQRINSNLEQLKVAREQIRMAKQAGLDVSAQEATANDQHAQLIRIKQTYFPGR